MHLLLGISVAFNIHWLARRRGDAGRTFMAQAIQKATAGGY